MSYALLDLLDLLDYGMSRNALSNPIGIIFRFLAFLGYTRECGRDIIIVHLHSTLLGRAPYET